MQAIAPMTIAELARRAGIDITLIRFYEEMGLLPALRRQRGRSGEIAYHEEHFERLVFIRRALDAGFSLDVMGELIGTDGGLPTCGDVSRLAERVLASLSKNNEPHKVETLSALIGKCDRSGSRRDCAILKELSRLDASEGQDIFRGNAGKAVAEHGDVAEQVRQSEKRYRALFEASPNAVIVIDRETLRLLDVNAAATRQYGWSRDEMLAMGIGDLHPADGLEAAAQTRPYLAGITPIGTELRHIRKDGTFIDVEVAVRFIEYDDRPATIAIVTDATERLRLQRAHASVEERLRAGQRLAAIGMLTGGLAHDFNNILMIIMANVDAVLEAEGMDARGRSSVQKIGAATERAADLTRQILAFSRKQTLRRQRIILNDVVAATATLLGRTLGEHVEINSLLAEDLWATDTDRSQVEATLINLCINARDSMPDGGRLLIETRNVTLDEDYVARNPEAAIGDHVVLSVTDDGSGMTPEVLSKAFEPFFTTKDAGKGTGLGLSMVYSFVQQSGGHVTIDSKLGQGTAVKLYLPRSEHDAPPRVTRPISKAPRGTERILLVEDEEQVRTIVARQLTSLGYIVTEAANGEAALALLRSSCSYDLLLADFIMPGSINGKALATEARRLQPDLPVLFMSGYSEDEITSLEILDSGVSLLSKPFRKLDLAIGLRRVFDATA